MPVCKKCSLEFPNWLEIEGIKRNLQNRKFCLDCSPRGKHNTRDISKNPLFLTERRCPSCKQLKSVVDFYKKRGKEGNSTYCKDCTTIQTVKRQRKLKLRAVAYKGGKCSVCDYSKCISALEFHHSDPSSKDPRLFNKRTVSFETIKSELDKCILLCANCHREIHEELRKKKKISPVGIEPTSSA